MVTSTLAWYQPPGDAEPAEVTAAVAVGTATAGTDAVAVVPTLPATSTAR